MSYLNLDLINSLLNIQFQKATLTKLNISFFSRLALMTKPYFKNVVKTVTFDHAIWNCMVFSSLHNFHGVWKIYFIRIFLPVICQFCVSFTYSDFCTIWWSVANKNGFWRRMLQGATRVYRKLHESFKTGQMRCRSSAVSVSKCTTLDQKKYRNK